MHVCKPVFHNGKLNSIRIKFVFYVVDLYYYILLLSDKNFTKP